MASLCRGVRAAAVATVAVLLLLPLTPSAASVAPLTAARGPAAPTSDVLTGAQAPGGAAAARLGPTALSATYTRVVGATGAKCPPSLVLGPAVAVGEVPPVVGTLTPGVAIAERPAPAGGTAPAPCTGGGLVAIDAVALFSPVVQDALGVPAALQRVLQTVLAVRQLVWSDVVGLNLSSWSCGGGGGRPGWPPNVHALFGDKPAVFGWPGNGTVRLAAGDRNFIVVNGTHVTCLMRAPPMAVGPPPVGAAASHLAARRGQMAPAVMPVRTLPSTDSQAAASTLACGDPVPQSKTLAPQPEYTVQMPGPPLFL